VFFFALGFYVVAWEEPDTAPPGGNVYAPLNTGSDAQTKSGNLTIGGNLESSQWRPTGTDDGRIIRTGGQIRYDADDNWYWYSTWDSENEMTLNYQNGLWLKSNLDADDVKARDQLCLGGDCRTSWPASIDLQGWSFQNDKLLDDGENVIQTSDEWLRLNQSGNFANGIYTPGKLRADGGLYVSDDERIYRCGEDYVCTDDNFMVTGGGWLRVDGSEGLYFQSYGGGWRMTDSTYIRSYGGKRVYLDNYLYAPRMYDQNNTGYYLDPNSNSRLYRIYANYFYYASDRSLKTNIQPISNGLGKVLQLQGVNFDWKDTGKPSVGLISQDVEKIFPEIVSTGEDGLKSIEYAKLVAPLIEAIKEQQKEIEELRLEIEKLKN